MNDQKMAQYLLGELSEDEHAELDEQYLASQESFERLQQAEDELIQRYLQNALSPRERALFEQRILSRPDKRKKVKLAQALLVYFTKERGQEQSTPIAIKVRQRLAGALQVLGDFLTPKRPAFKLAHAIAIVVMIAAISWLSVRLGGLQSRLSQAEQAREAFLQRERDLQQQVKSQREQNAALTEQLQSARNQRIDFEKKAPPQSAPRRFSTITLVAGGLRDTRATRGVANVSIKPEEPLVRFQLNLDENRLYDHYRAFLETAAGDTLWGQYQLQAQQTAQGLAVFLVLPAQIFSNETYVITLNGVAAAGKGEYLASYVFNAVKE